MGRKESGSVLLFSAREKEGESEIEEGREQTNSILNQIKGQREKDFVNMMT